MHAVIFTRPALPLALLGCLLPAAAAAQAPPRTDRHGDPLPAAAVGRLGTTRLRHGGPIFDVAFFPDGKTLASVSGDSYAAVALWDLVTGKERQYFRLGPGKRIGSAWSPDFRLVATSDGDTVRVHELATGTPRWENRTAVVPAGAGPFPLIHFSGDGRFLASAGGDRRHVHVWDAVTGKKVYSLDMKEHGGTGGVGSLLSSPNGKLLVTANTQSDCIVLWDLLTGKRLYDRRGRAGDPAPAFSPDGGTLAAVPEDARTVVLREASTGRPLDTIEHAAQITCLVFAPDGQTLAIGGNDGTVRLWDATRRRDTATLGGVRARVARLDFSRDGRRLAAGIDMRSTRDVVEVWQVADGKELLRFAPPRWNAGWPCVLAPDGATLAVAGFDTVQLWDVATGKQRHPPHGDDSPIIDLAVAPDGRTVATYRMNATIQVWDVAAQTQRVRWHGPMRGQPQLAFTADGKMLTCLGIWGDLATVWDAANGELVRRVQGPEKRSGTSWALAPDGRTVAWTLVDGARLMDALTGKGLAWLDVSRDMEPGPHDGRLPRIEPWSQYQGVFAPDSGRLAAYNRSAPDRPIVQWDVATSCELAPLAPVGQGIIALGYSPDGRTVAGLSACSGDMHFWEALTGKPCGRIAGSAALTCLAFAPTAGVLRLAQPTAAFASATPPPASHWANSTAIAA